MRTAARKEIVALVLAGGEKAAVRQVEPVHAKPDLGRLVPYAPAALAGKDSLALALIRQVQDVLFGQL